MMRFRGPGLGAVCFSGDVFATCMNSGGDFITCFEMFVVFGTQRVQEAYHSRNEPKRCPRLISVIPF
jgi:hypothetical protein